MLIPLAAAFIFRELNPLYDFLISFLICLIFGNGLILLCETDKDLNWVGGNGGSGPGLAGGGSSGSWFLFI